MPRSEWKVTPFGDRRPVFVGKSLVRPLDGGVENAGADAVVLANTTGENEIVGLAPLGSELVLAQELHKLGFEDDLANAGGGLGSRDIEDALAKVEISPAQVGQLGDQAAGPDRRRDQRSVLASLL
jgi:hypothetical protein